MLPKPFYISELVETVRAVLRATDSAPINSRRGQSGEAGWQQLVCECDDSTLQ